MILQIVVKMMNLLLQIQKGKRVAPLCETCFNIYNDIEGINMIRKKQESDRVPVGVGSINDNAIVVISTCFTQC